MVGEAPMKLHFGKTDWLELELVPIASEVRNGVRTFRSTGPGTGRAAVLANAATKRVFEKAVPSFATMAERAAIGADKVKTAVFRDPSGALRVVYREVVVR